jgi:hypothetical protein
MGLYKAMKGKLNNRRVYKHTEGGGGQKLKLDK